MSNEETHKKLIRFLSYGLVILSIILLVCWWYKSQSFKRRNISNTRGLTFDGFNPVRGLNFNSPVKYQEGFTLTPKNDFMTDRANRNGMDLLDVQKLMGGQEQKRVEGLNDRENSDSLLKKSGLSKAIEKVVNSKWLSDASISLGSTQRKVEGMADGDETQWSRDRDNMGPAVDPTLNELVNYEDKLRLTPNDMMPSVSGMTNKWTDTAMDDIRPMYGGYGMYGATNAKINT